MYAEKYEAHDPAGHPIPRGGTIEASKLCGVTVGMKPSIEVLKDRSLRMADQVNRVDQRAQQAWRRRIGMEVQYLDKIEAARERHQHHLDEKSRKQREINWNWESRALTMSDFRQQRVSSAAQAGMERQAKEQRDDDDFRERLWSLMGAAPERILDIRVGKLTKDFKESHAKMEKYHTRWLGAKEASRPPLHENWMPEKVLSQKKDSERVEGIRSETPEASRRRKKATLLKTFVMGNTPEAASLHGGLPSAPVHTWELAGFNQTLPQAARATSMKNFPTRSAMIKAVRESKKDLDVLPDSPLGHKPVVKPKREKAAVSRILWKMAKSQVDSKDGLSDLKKAMNVGEPPASPRSSHKGTQPKGILRNKSPQPGALTGGGILKSRSLPPLAPLSVPI